MKVKGTDLNGKETTFEVESKKMKALEALRKIVDYHYIDNEDEELDIIEKALKDFEWLKSKLNLTFLHSLSSPEDKMRVMKIMGVEYGSDDEKEN